MVEDDTAEALDKAVEAKHRIEKQYAEGETIFVWRKNPLSTGWWQGPGLVVLAQGNNVWVSIKGGLWKCGRTQLRPATSEEQMGCELINKHLPSLYRALKSNGQKKFVDITMEEDAPVDPRAAEQPAEPAPAEPAAPVEPAEPPAPATPSTAAPAESPMGIESELATPGTVHRDLPDSSTPVARLPWFPGTSSTSATRFPVIPEESLEPELRRLVDAKEQSQGVRRPGGDLEELEAGNGVVHKMDTATQRSRELWNAEPRPMHEGKPIVLWCREYRLGANLMEFH